jgi:hypothetical protein
MMHNTIQCTTGNNELNITSAALLLPYQYLKDKINELESNSTNKNTRYLYKGINEFKKCYQPRTKLVQDERGDLLADPHRILNTWKNYFCQLLNVNRASSIRQTEMRTAEPCVPEPSASEVEVAIG